MMMRNRKCGKLESIAGEVLTSYFQLNVMWEGRPALPNLLITHKAEIQISVWNFKIFKDRKQIECLLKHFNNHKTQYGLNKTYL